MGFDKVRLFNPQLVRRVAQEHIRIMFDRITKYGQDAQGRIMKPYTKKYAEMKSGGMFKKRQGKGGKKYAAFSAGPGKASLSTNRQIHPPNLILRGNTMRDLLVRIWLQDRYCVGWRGEQGAIIGFNAERGRDVASGIPEKEFAWVQDRFDKLVDQELTKIKDINVTIGRR